MVDLSGDEHLKKQAQLLSRAWEDEAFRERLKKEPRAVLTEMEIPVRRGVELRVVEDTDTVKHLPLPPFVGPKA